MTDCYTREELLTHLQKGTGTENGIHKWANVARCARRAALDAQASSEREGLPFTFKEARDVGTLFHLFAASYHTVADARTPDLDGWPVDEFRSICAEAVRLSREYAARYAADCWGTAIKAEQAFQVTLLGISAPLTGQVDLVTRVDEEQAAKLEARLGQGVKPGVYLVDHKTHKQKDSNLFIKDMWSLQACLYGHWAQREYGEEYRGMIFNHIVRHKKMDAGSFAATLVEAPSAAQVQQLTSWLQWCESLRAANRCNLAACTEGFEMCPYRMNGGCELL